MRVSITRPNGTEIVEDVESILAAGPHFPYWIIRYPVDEHGKVRARFFAINQVLEIDLEGEAEQEERTLASVTPINREEDYFGGDSNRPIS